MRIHFQHNLESMLSSDPASRLERAYTSLAGLSVGDALGECFFVHPDLVDEIITSRAIPASPWHFTDDTLMALSIVSQLETMGTIDQDRLATSFAEHYAYDRGYGPAMHGLLARIREGEEWREAASALFEGQGSYGNGGAMRVAPLGAYFADDLEAAIGQAVLSTEVTHSHEEAIAGSIAVAVAAALACRYRVSNELPPRAEFLDQVQLHLPVSEVRSRLCRARDMNDNATVAFAVSILGNGVGVSAQDTVPFALWSAATHLGNYEETFWLTVSGLGDRDTTCAIAGGVVASYTGVEGIPAGWIAEREALPSLPFS
jgi:ADP-ribosylglycohydrolase